MKPCRLLLFTRPTEGGAARYIQLLCQYLNKNQFHVVLLCEQDGDPSFYPFFAQQGVEVIPLPIQRDISLLHDWKAACFLYNLLKKRSFDVLHVHTSKPGALGRLVGKLHHIPTVYTPHGFYFTYNLPPWKRALFFFMEKLLAQTGAFLLCCTRDEYRIATSLVSAPNRCGFISNAVFPPSQRPVHPVSEKIIFTFIGRLAPPKDPLTFVRAGLKFLEQGGDSKNSRCSNILFRVVGEGELKKKCLEIIDRSAVQKPRLRSSFQFLPVQKDLTSIYQTSYALVLTTHFEGLPYVILEAMAQGVPVIATHTGGCKDVIQSGTNGFLVPPASVDALVQTLVDLVHYPEVRERLSQAAFDTIQKSFHVHSWIQNVEAFYLRYLGRNAR